LRRPADFGCIALVRNAQMELSRSTRHAKLAGDFGESLVLYWLSKYGFECAKVDHTGIDVIARNPHTTEVMGISVKSRTRSLGKETRAVILKEKDIAHTEAACEQFRCTSYFALVVDAAGKIRVFVVPAKRLVELHAATKDGWCWKMTESHCAKYAADEQIMAFELETRQGRWWKNLST
jgi:hypothetical protein